jgi:phage terminase small subunit
MSKTKPAPKRKPKQEIEVVDNGLTIKQRLFIDHYIVCMNATEAARLAGYEGDSATLAVMGSQNLRNHNVLREIDTRLNKFTMSANEVLIQLTDIARGDIADAVNALGGIDVTEAVRRGKSGNIKRFKTKTTTTIGKGKDDDDTEVFEAEIEMYDRLDALKTLAKFHSLLIDRVRQEDWRTDIIKLLQEGAITPEQIEAELGTEIARELVTTVVLPSVNAGESRQA